MPNPKPFVDHDKLFVLVWGEMGPKSIYRTREEAIDTINRLRNSSRHTALAFNRYRPIILEVAVTNREPFDA